HEALGVRDRTLLPQLVPDRIGILDPARIEVVEIGGPIGDGRSAAHGSRSRRSAIPGYAVADVERHPAPRRAAYRARGTLSIPRLRSTPGARACLYDQKTTQLAVPLSTWAA